MNTKIATFAYWLDLGTKTVIAAVLGLATWHCKRTIDRVDLLESHDAHKTADIAVLKNEAVNSGKQLDRIEAAVIKQGDKLDKIWEIAREVHK